jgi:RNA polymerase subunit RPABC4/transcription elongation factor Spt4
VKACPACRRSWSDDHEVCPDCLAQLVDSLDATLTCRSCGHVCPARMQTCPECFALLREEDIDATEELAHSLVTGRPMHRPPGRAPFGGEPGGTIRRVSHESGLVFEGLEGLLEAWVSGSDHRAEPPLTCHGDDDEELLRLEAYGAADDALVAIGPDGAALATYLRVGGIVGERIDVRDETSAPVARLERGEDGIGFVLVETGGQVLAMGDRVDAESDGWIDDEWTITPIVDRLPISAMALAGLVIAAKVLLGRPEPEPSVDTDEVLGALGTAIALRALGGLGDLG